MNLEDVRVARELHSLSDQDRHQHLAKRLELLSARYVFLDPTARDFYVDWDRAASDVVAVLRSAAGRDPPDRDLSDLVGELSTQSAEFRTRWAATTSASTTPAPRSSTTPSSATSPSPITAWS